MLLLTRRVGEELIIGDDIIITISGIRSNQVKIGITAPKHIPINRKEIHDRLLKENRKFITKKKETYSNHIQTSHTDYMET